MGPSKEELANYFKNNRKYFDELANHFKQTDPTYYNENIAPFYSNPFVSIGGKRAGRPAIAVFAAMISVFMMGILVFFLVNKKSSIDDVKINEKKIDKKVDVNIDENEYDVQSDPIKILDTISAIKGLGNYEKGIMYYNLGDFNKAEKYLEKVPENDVLYKDAKEKLKDIKKKKGGTKVK